MSDRRIIALRGANWTVTTARRILPLVVAAADNRSTITYGQCLHFVAQEYGTDEAGGRAQKYGRPAGVIGNACEQWGKYQGRRVPPLNAIMVNKDTRLPSEGVNGFISRYLKFREPGRIPNKADLGVVINDVLDFGHWGELLNLVGLAPVDQDVTSDVWNFRGGRGEGGPESDEHKALKRAAASSGEFFGAHERDVGIVERALPTGDRVDAFFERSRIVIEVKPISSPASDIHRGIWQAFKYGCVVAKMGELSKRGKAPQCHVVLAGWATQSLMETAAALGVKVHERVKINDEGRLELRKPPRRWLL